MTTLSLFEGTISDQTTKLTLTVRRDLESDLPIALIVDGNELGLPLDIAARLARAGDRIERALFRAKEAPREASTIFCFKLAFAHDGTLAPFEIGIVADPIGASLTWHTKRLVLGPEAIADLLFALSQVGSAVDAIRHGMPRPFQPQPRPGERWLTARPQFHDPDERPREWIHNSDW